MNTTNTKKYEIRPGTINQGPDYEVKTIALLSLNCVLYGVKEMRIAFNLNDVGEVDDIVLHVVTSENERNTIMMQLKHKENMENKIGKGTFLTKKGDFPLKKLSQDISDLQQPSTAKGKIVEDLGQFDNIYFVLFTNRGIHEDNDILVNKSYCDKLNRFLKDVLNTSAAINTLYGFDLKNLPEKIVEKDNFNSVYLLANQLSCKDIGDKIGDKIIEIINIKELAQEDIRSMALKFIQYIKDWAWGRDHYYLTKHDVLFKITDLFFTHYAVNLSQHRFNFYGDDKQNMWNQIMCHEKIKITVVESNNVVLQFLRMYISSEIKKHCQVPNNKFWGEKLSCQSLFSKTNQDLKEQMLKIAGNLDQITLIDVYKYLWMLKKLPLLLEVTRIEDYESILHVLKFTNYSYKVIVINNSTGNLLRKEIGTKIFYTLQDLPFDYKEAILNLPIKLQSRTGVVLGNVIDESMLHYIKCNDVINILLNNFNIGNNLNQLPAYFIQRSFLKTFIKAQAVRELNEDIFILDNRSNLYFSLFPQNDFNASKLEDVDFDILNNYKAILQENDEPELIKKIKSAGKTVHYLSMHDQNSFQWKWSSGSTKNIKPYQKEEYERDIEPCFSNAVNIISDTAGMGKSTLMDFVQHKAPTNKWVIRVNLNNHQKYIYDCRNSNIDACKHLKYFNDRMLSEQSPSSKLSQMVFEKLVNTKDIIVILDGFDEVSFSHEDGVLKIAKSLYLEGYHIWLTTRPHMQLDLEQQFETFSINLKPFSEEDQHQFLAKVFSLVNSELILGSEFLLKTFVEKLLGAARKNLSDLDAKFTGIPLQGKLLADVFNEDCRNYLLSKGTTCFNETFDLVYLYQNFIDKKIEILCNKFGESEINMHYLFKRYQTLFALKHIYPYHTFIKNYVKELDEYYRKKPEKIQLLQRDGIITVDEKQNINCVHQTFAEFLVATWLSENFNCEQKHIKEFVHSIINDQFKSLFHQNDDQFCSNMFNHLVAHDNCPAHLAIMNRQIGKVNEIISSSNSSAIEVLDKSGRSILHTICIYGVRFPLYNADDIVYYNGYLLRNDFEIHNFESDDMLAILKTIPDATIRKLAIKKDGLGYNPLDYALLHRSFAIANHICSKIDAITINTRLLKHLNNRLCCAFCVQFNFQSLFKVFLPYLACGDLLMNLADLKIDVLCHLSDRYKINVNDNHFLNSYKKVTLSQVMQSESSCPYSGFTNDHYSDLRFAAAFGTKQNVLNVLSQGIDIDINRLDYNMYTPLHYAVLHANSETIEALIVDGANINMKGNDGNTPLHIAVMEYSKKIIPARYSIVRANDNEVVSNEHYHNITLLLRSKDIDVNKQNSFGETPLLVLVAGWRKIHGYMCEKYIPTWYSSNIMALIKLLISSGANVNTDKQHGVPILHFACQMNFIEFVIESLPKIDDIHIPDRDGRTGLHVAVLNGNCDLVKILLFNDADINKSDRSGCTSLHLATTGEMATLLITEGANIHLETKDGETALHRQASCGRAEIVNELLQTDLDVNKQTNNGDTALHLAVKNVSVEATFEHECTINNID